MGSLNTYRIQHKVKTLAALTFLNPNRIEISGYKIENWGFSEQKGRYGDARVVEKTIGQENYIDALNVFRREFQLIAERLSLISQCYLEFLDESFLVEKLTDNPERLFFMHDISERSPVGLHLGDQELKNFRLIENELMQNPCFKYLQQCNNTIGYYSKLSLLCSALEALAGKVEKDGEGGTYTTYDKTVMKEILGNVYFNIIFGSGGLRQKIQHGDFITDFQGEDFVSLIYKKIIEYFNSHYGLELSLDIASPQRHFYGNLTVINCFLKPKDPLQNIDLREIPEKIQDAVMQEEGLFMYENMSSEGY